MVNQEFDNDSPVFHLPYTLPSSVSCNSFICHSYENTGGVGLFFPFWNSLRLLDARTLQPYNVPTCLLFWKPNNDRQHSTAASARHAKEETHAVTHATVSARAAKRVHNFNAGPGALPLPVLERIREELLDWRGSGMSVMEMSHRSPEFEGINAAAEQKLRNLLGISEDYAVIFVQGGGSMQFSMAPMNLSLPGKPVDVLHTGAWTAKAIGELKKGFLHHVAASTESEKFARLPRRDEMKFSPEASYVHICTNNTIEGTQWTTLPDAGNAPLVADMSSDIASHPIDVNKFGVIFAGAQKNLGPSGVTVVIIRKDLGERADKNLPTLLQYRTHIKEKSLYHTPPTFAVYIVGLVLEWIESEGGIQGMQKRNDAKAGLLYNTIESSGGFYSCPVEKGSRSKMNVVFRVAAGTGPSTAAQSMDSPQKIETTEKKFAAEAAAAGLVGTPGHRSVGGMRVSLYNAVEPAAVEALTSFMREFQRTSG
jgi:phosphoserine aminotransferase